MRYFGQSNHFFGALAFERISPFLETFNSSRTEIVFFIKDKIKNLLEMNESFFETWI